jgi:outer membrane lipoprotein-sorting protein
VAEGAELSAAQIAEKNVMARGGLAGWRAVSALRMTGKIDAGRVRPPPTAGLKAGAADRRLMHVAVKSPQTSSAKIVQLPFVMEMKRQHRMRLEIEFQGESAVQVFDGARGWKLRPFLGRHEIEPYTEEESKLAAGQQELDGLLIDYQAKGTRVESEGIEPVEGRDAYKLKLTLKTGQVHHVWVDSHNFLDVMMDGTRRLDGTEHLVLTHLRDYRATGGLQIPYTLETRVDGVTDAESIHVEQVVVNPQISDTRFAKPL